MIQTSSIRTLCLAGLLIVGSPVLPVAAQTLVFEQVGDTPLDAESLNFNQDGVLWAADRTTECWYYDSEHDTWIQPSEPRGGRDFLPLAGDTLLVVNGIATHRSTNSGETWTWVNEEGDGALFAAAVDGPNHGVILTGERNDGKNTGIAYSTDRGASFTEATFTMVPQSTPTMETAVEIPDGPAAGRLVAGVFAGVVISEDGGQTWSPSSLFQNARYWAQRMEIGLHPTTGERRLYLSVADAQEPDVQFYYSDDDGLTWINAPDAEDTYLFVSVPTTGDLLSVERADGVPGTRLNVWRSTDGAQTWQPAGELPAEPGDNLIYTDDMLIGPDGHVYVAVGRTGTGHEWVYRSTEPVVVANEPPPEMPTEETRLRIYPNPAASHITVETDAARGDPRSPVEILDVLGRVVLRAGTGGRIDISSLPVGAYLIRAGSQLQRFTVLR